MKVTLKLDYGIMHAIARGVSKQCALAWFESAGLSCEGIPDDAIVTLYEYAFADGMQHLAEMFEEGSATLNQ